jgi:predicted ATPase
MITHIQLNNFKCFQKSTYFEFSKINLITGINGRGKSTVLQSLILLAQTTTVDARFKSLAINGPLIQLGDYDDIKNSDTSRGTDIIFNFKTSNREMQEFSFSFTENELNAYLPILKNLSIKSNDNNIVFDLKNLGQYSTPPDNNRELTILWNYLFSLHYISADRLGPVKYVDKTQSSERLYYVGSRGEYTINILANDDLPLVNEILYRGSDARTVIQQTEEWLGYILEGANIEIKGKDKDSSVLSMIINNKNSSSKYKPINIGFGYSYILPLIVAGLVAEPGQIIVIENPEAHLHPRAQSKITEFFCKVASCGVQVFIESHSEHILNGLRVNSLDSTVNIFPSDISIQYFNETFTSTKLEIDKKGKIANWPSGFFDQQEIDLSNIFKQSRSIQ